MERGGRGPREPPAAEAAAALAPLALQLARASGFNGSFSQEKPEERCQRLAEHVLNFLGRHDPGQPPHRLLQ